MTNRALLALVVSVVTFSCAPDPKVVAQRTATDVKSLVREAWVASEGSNNWATLDSSLLAIGVSAETRSTSARVPPVSSFDTALDPLSKRLDRVFAEANIVDKTGGALTFQVRGVDLCTEDNGALNAACAESVDRAKLLVKATGDLDLTLLVGEAKAEAFTIEIRAGVSLAVVIDLEKSITAMTALQQAQSGMSVTYDFKAKGKVEWRLVKNGKDDFTLSASVLSPVSYEMTGSDGVTRSATIGTKSPLASVRLEGPAKRATLQYGYGEVRYAGLLRDLFTSETESSRPLDVFLSGAGFSLIFEEGKTARLEGVGFGNATSTIKSGTDVLLSFDFNKDQGRTVSATWEPTAAGFKLNFTPGLQLDAHVGLGAIASTTYVVKPEHLNATYSASFLATGGKSPSIEFFTARSSTDGAPIARLLEGELKFSVDDALIAARSFSAPACLASFSGTRNNTYVESVVSVDCP
jgi:hypothetical protein